MSKIQITTPGIRKALNRYDYPQAIAEYIWNGFDAGATKVDVTFEVNSIGNIQSLQVTDNGSGIPHEKLAQKFEPFFESDKEIDPQAHRTTSAVHGKNGVGRLTFFTFAAAADWDTVYTLHDKRYAYNISVGIDSLNVYSETKPVETDRPLGTTVTFTGIHTITKYNVDTEIEDFLSREFCWFLELNRAVPFTLAINGVCFDYSRILGEREAFDFKEDGFSFGVRYVRWDRSLNREYSRYYLLDSTQKEKFKETTTLNNKGDQFYHSVYITSELYDHLDVSSVRLGEEDIQPDLFVSTTRGKTHKKAIDSVDGFLREKRRPFLIESSDKLIIMLKADDAFPDFGTNEWDAFRRNQLEAVIKELFQIEPRIFHSLNIEQKKTIVRLINLIIDSGERDALLEILAGIVELAPADRAQLGELLKSSTLSGIIRTIKLIEDRYRAVAELKELVFNRELAANERDHIQKAVEDHYWLFGEQYHLITAAEPKFEEALRRFVYLLRGETVNPKIDHPDKSKEMDIFLVRQLRKDTDNVVDNVVLELKRPGLQLGEKEVSQVKRYLSVIRSQSEFNASNMAWEFYLVGSTIDAYIEGEIKNSRPHGERSLLHSVDNHKIYVKTWSEVFAEFELRHGFLLDKLTLARDKLATTKDSAATVVSDLHDNTARQTPQVRIPKKATRKAAVTDH